MLNPLLSLALALLVSMPFLNMWIDQQMNEASASAGKAIGGQLLSVSTALDNLIIQNSTTLSTCSGSTSLKTASGLSTFTVANCLSPTVAELVTGGYLPVGTNSTPYNGGSFIIQLTQSGSGFQIGGMVATSRGFTLAPGQLNLIALGAAVDTMGSDGGYATAATQFAGPNGTWTYTLAGTPFGAVGLRVGLDAQRWNAYYSRDGKTSLTAPLQMGSQVIRALAPVSTGSACTKKGDVAQDSTTGAPVYCNADGGTYASIGGSTPVVNTTASLATCNASSKGNLSVVLTPAVTTSTGAGPRIYACDGTTWQATGVDNSGNLEVPGLLTVGKTASGGLNLARTATVGAACNAATDGNIAMNSDGSGSLLSCQPEAIAGANCDAAGIGAKAVEKSGTTITYLICQ